MKSFNKIAYCMVFILVFVQIPSLRVNADFEIHWKDEVTYRVVFGEEYDTSLSEAHPFHYYFTYNWDYAKEATAALREVQIQAGKTPSSENNYVYYMGMLRGLELGIDGSHGHNSPAHGNLFQVGLMPYGENFTTVSSADYRRAIYNWTHSVGHYDSIINNQFAMAYGGSNGGSVAVFSSMPDNSIYSVTQKNLIKGMPLYENPYTNRAYYRIQFDESDFYEMTLSGISHYEGTYYQTSGDDIGHVVKHWTPIFVDDSQTVYSGEIRLPIGTKLSIYDRLYESTSCYWEENVSLSTFQQNAGTYFNNCYVNLALDNFTVTSTNPSIVSVDDNYSLTVNGSGNCYLVFTSKLDSSQFFSRGVEVVASGSSPDSATTEQTVQPGVDVETSEGEYEVGYGNTVTYVEPVNGAKTNPNLVIPNTIKINNKSYKVTTIAPGAYANNPNIQSVTCGKYVTTIGKEAFKGCASLTSFVAPNVKTIGKGAFYGCSNLQSVSAKNVTSIEEKAFSQCTSLSSMSLGKVKTIKKEAFKGCAFRSVSLDKAVTVGDGAFSYNSSLSSITFGKSLKKLGKKVFYKDRAMKKITIKSSKYKPSASTYSGLPKKTPVKVPKSIGKMYKNTWKKAKIKLKY